MSANFKTYEVFSKPYLYTDVISDEQGPTYEALDYCLVKAHNRDTAKILALRIFRDKHFTKKQYGDKKGMSAKFLRQYPDENPFKGMKIVRAQVNKDVFE